VGKQRRRNVMPIGKAPRPDDSHPDNSTSNDEEPLKSSHRIEKDE
jgi:hypothetical protein